MHTVRQSWIWVSDLGRVRSSCFTRDALCINAELVNVSA